MKSIVYSILALMFSFSVYAQDVKTVQIYSNGLTHDNIKANITYNKDGKIEKDEFFYTITTSAMWTGKLSTVVAYNGSYDQIQNFFTELLQFAEENEKNMNAKTVIDGREISRKKVAGVKCIVIKNGNESTNTNIKSLRKALESLKKWKMDNMY